MAKKNLPPISKFGKLKIARDLWVVMDCCMMFLFFQSKNLIRIDRPAILKENLNLMQMIKI